MSWKGYNKKQNEYFNRILDLLMDETIISGSELKFPFLSPGTNSKDLYNQFLPYPTKGIIHFINRPLSPNLTTMSYKIGEYMKEVYGVTDEEVGFLWDLYRERIKSKLNKFLAKQLPQSVFKIIQADLFDRTVKVPRTNKPLCTGGDNLNDYRVNDEEINGDGPYNKPNFVIQLNLPSSEFPYNVEMGRGRSWGQLNDYLKQQYGLTQEECDGVWDEYRTTICKEPALPINESKSFNPTHFNFLEKVSQTIADNTPIYYKEDALHIEFPYFNIPTHETYRAPKSNWEDIGENGKLHHYDTQIHSVKEIITGLWPSIGGKIMDIFGLTHTEADIIYPWYQSLLKRKTEEVLGPIFEIDPITKEWNPPMFEVSEKKLYEAAANIITHPDDEDPYSFDWHPEPKKRKFYEAVLRDVVNDTTIEVDGVISVGNPEVSHQRGLLFHNLSHSYDVGPFLKHLRDTYGLVHHETHPIWSRWEHIMVDKIKKWLTAKGIKLSDAGYEEPLWSQNDEEEINESKNKNKREKQQKVLDYAIEDLTDNTLLAWGSNPNDVYQIIQFPFSIYPKEGSSRLEWIMIDKHYNLDISQFYNQFKSYAKLMYGLTDVELMKGFADWEGEVIEKIRDHSETDTPRH